MTTMPLYDTLAENVAKEYGPKAEALLTRIADMLQAEGWQVNGPHDLSGDDYRWYLNVARIAEQLGDEGSIDITVQIAEERAYDGYGGEPDNFGLNFALDIVEYGGRILGGLSPFNYTSGVWVDIRDPEAVAERWSYVEDAPIAAVAELLEEAS